MIHISLFAGIGGFDLAAEEVGWTNGASCEINDFCHKVLQYHFPKAYHHRDVKTLTYEILNEELTKRFGPNWRANGVILSGGFPCQGFSVAGLRLGTDDDRYLWPEYLRIIDEINPDWVCGENVTGILSMEDKSGVYRDVFAKVANRKITKLYPIDHYEAIYTRQAKMLVGSICESLEERGYAVQTFAIPAASVEAPHKRERIWFVANSQRNRGLRNSGGWGDLCNSKRNYQEKEQQRHDFTDGIGSIIKERATANTNNKRRSPGRGEVQKEDGKISERNNDAEPCNSNNGITANTGCITGDPWKGSQTGCINNRETTGRNESSEKPERLCETGSATDTNEVNGRRKSQERGEATRSRGQSDRCNKIYATDTIRNRGRESMGRKQSEQFDKDGKTKTVDADSGSPGQQELNVPDFAAKSGHGSRNGDERNGDRGRFYNFPTQSPVCGRNDGIPSKLDGITFSKWRNESIKAFGNAVVWLIPYEIFKAINEYERSVRQ